MPPDPAAVWRIHPVVVSADGATAPGAIQDLSDLCCTSACGDSFAGGPSFW
jgi:hypothetical protein